MGGVGVGYNSLIRLFDLKDGWHTSDTCWHLMPGTHPTIAASDGSDAFARCARLVPKLVPLFGMCSQPMRRYNGISGAVELR